MDDSKVTLPMAMELKRLGFNESCNTLFEKGFPVQESNMNYWLTKEHYSQPSYVQVQAWFRKTWGLAGFVVPSKEIRDEIHECQYSWKWVVLKTGLGDGTEMDGYLDYEGALRDCVEEMIKYISNTK